jgi:hypothetical protein
MQDYHKLEICRVCNSDSLISVLNLGKQSLTGVFPKNKAEEITAGPLELVWCAGCNLLQLNHSYNPSEMYGENYGYRSGLNNSMVRHLNNKVHYLENYISLNDGDIVVDIGSNDATTLKAYKKTNLKKIGIDPTGKKFIEYYPSDILLIPDFFSASVYNKSITKPARLITSIAMFYDLEVPIEFAKQIESILAEDGIWHFEQSYMPSMLRLNSYDTICHEHLEYYSLNVIKNILESSGLKIVDVIMNSINGGSFAVTAAKKSNKSIKVNNSVINWLLEQEDRMALNNVSPYRDFEERVYRHRDDLRRLIHSLNADGKKVFGYGASTKGNVILQFCGFTEKDIPFIAEVNSEKYGAFTPGSKIPIISEEEAHKLKPDYFLVLPWHFKDGIINKEQDYIFRGGKFIIPFPEIEII